MIIEFPHWVVGAFAIGFRFHYIFGPISADFWSQKLSLSLFLHIIHYAISFNRFLDCIEFICAAHTRIANSNDTKIKNNCSKRENCTCNGTWVIVASSGGQHPLPFNSNRMNFHYKLKFDKMEWFCIVLCCVYVYMLGSIVFFWASIKTIKMN